MNDEIRDRVEKIEGFLECSRQRDTLDSEYRDLLRIVTAELLLILVKLALEASK